MRLQLISLALISATTVSCGSDSKDNNSDQPTNTLTTQTLSEKINDGSSIYTGMSGLRQSFGSGASKTLLPSQLRGLLALEDEPTDQDSDDAMNYLPSTTAITDCASGFDMFESMFAQAKSDYEDMAAGFANPQTKTDENTDIKEVTPAADEAVAYEFVPKQQMEGMSISGRFAGGGTDTTILLRHNMEMTMDYAKIFGNQQFPGDTMPDTGDDESQMPDFGAAMGAISTSMKNTVLVDLTAKVATSDIDMTMSQTQEGQTQTQKVTGKITISNGDEKYVTQEMSVQTQSSETQAFTTQMTARLVDANTVNITGTFQGPGAPGNINVTIKKSAASSCTIDATAP